MAMLDVASFFLAVPMFLGSFSTYPKHLKRLMLFLVLWLVNAIVSDLWRGTPFLIGFKAWMVIFNSLTMVIVAAWMLKKSVQALPFFLVGCAISTVIQLYYFQNGALLVSAIRAGYDGRGEMTDFLVEKQVYPIWVGMFLSILMALRIMGILPWPICIAGYFAGGFFLLARGGARSMFLINVCSAILICAYVYWRKFFKAVFKKKLLTLGSVFIAAILFNEIYMQVASAGLLGENGYKKVEEKKSGGSTLLDNRADFLINWPFLWRSPIIGAGSEFIDRWGYVDKSPFVAHYDLQGRPLYHDTFYGHSCIVGAWTGNGIFGLVFWAYVLWLVFDFLGERLYVLKDAGPYVMASIVGICWHIAFSPYGMFRGKAMFLAVFLALVQDPRYFAWLGGMPVIRSQNIRQIQ